MSSLGLDDRIRDLYLKLARSREREVRIALNSRDASHPSRCRRLTHADGTPFWSFDWQHSPQNLAQQTDTATPPTQPNPPAA
jgi:hypothetical protein